jgi:GT2 family glycosyltransferase
MIENTSPPPPTDIPHQGIKSIPFDQCSADNAHLVNRITDFPLVFAVTLNWNQADNTLACLESLTQLEGIRCTILLVDNASTDDSVLKVRQRFPQVEILVNPSNLGFGKGFNLGMRVAYQAGADYVFIINNDTYLAPDTLSILLQHAADDVGILAPVIYYASQPAVIWAIGGKVNPLNLEVAEKGRGTVNTGNWPSDLEHDFVTGCAMLLPRHTLEKVGFFDEAFQMYYEDADFCRRVRQAGLRILVVTKARLWHKVSASSGGSDSPNERYFMGRSSVRFFRKHGRGVRMWVIVPYRLGSAIKTTLRLLRAGRMESSRAYWRGLRDGLRDKP